MYYITTGKEQHHKIHRDLVDVGFKNHRHLAVDDLAIGDIILGRWKCEYSQTIDIYNDIYNLQHFVTGDIGPDDPGTEAAKYVLQGRGGLRAGPG